MANVINQFQSGVSSTANTLMTQLMCAEKGIDYNQLMQQAQQSHLQGILQQEQMRQMEQLVKRHYGGGTFVGKIKDIFSPEQSVLFNNPMSTGFPMTSAPAPSPMLPQAGMDTMALANILASRTPVQQPVVQQQPAPQQQAIPFGGEQDRINNLEQDITDMKNMIMSLSHALTQQTQQQPQQQQPQYQQQQYYTPQP